MKVVWIWWSTEDAVEQVNDGVSKELRECVETYQRLKQEKEDLEKKEKMGNIGAAKG